MRRIQFKGYGIELPKNTAEFKGQIRYRISEGESQISLAVSACEKALKNANITINDDNKKEKVKKIRFVK